MDASRTIRVLVVDDSAFMRKTISAILNEPEDIEVVATARDGMDAIQKVTDYSPDVVTLDLEMPKMDGLSTLGYIMSECPTPVVMLSAYTETGGEGTMKALEYGAVDFICKPSGPISLDLHLIADELVAKVRLASHVDVSRLKFLEFDKLIREAPLHEALIAGHQVVAIASSTGGPRALYDLIPKFPEDLSAAVIVVQHMSAGFVKPMADRMNLVCALVVKEAQDGDVVLAGHVYIAPSDHHLVVEREAGREVIRLNQAPLRNSVRPSADVTFESLAQLYGPNCVGVVLTGIGRDGTQGAQAIKQNQGRVFAQDEATSVVYGMPKSVFDAGWADEVLPIQNLADRIMVELRLMKLAHQPRREEPKK